MSKSIDDFAAQRLRGLLEWQRGRTSTVTIGAGKYGKVYLCGAKLDAVMKETWTKGEKAAACKQAFREHVVALFQTLLVLDGQAPHLPLHYGCCIEARAGGMLGQMYMERFEGSLEKMGTACLVTAEDWLGLAFQLMHSIVVLSELLDLSHNDAYPRNVLISPSVQVGAVTYEVTGETYRVPWRGFAALTDFGIASSVALLGRRSAPEVADRLKPSPSSASFGDVPPTKHILRYSELPVFSRDAYTILKWIRFPTQSLPPAPDGVRLWASSSLRLLDETQDALARPCGLKAAFHSIFAPEWLKRHELPSFAAPGGEAVDFALCGDDAYKVSLFARAERGLAGLPLTSRSAFSFASSSR